MAALVETETFEPEIYQLEITDPVIGGLNGIDNLQGKQLANRTKWLKAKIDSILSMSFIHSATAENPGDTDEFGYWDSFSLTLRKVTLANLKATLLAYFDNFYSRTTAIFGIGQSRVNVAGSRVLGTTYTNTTGKTIFVIVTVTSATSTACSITATVASLGAGYGYVPAISGVASGQTLCFPVLNGELYAVSSPNTLAQWTEIR